MLMNSAATSTRCHGVPVSVPHGWEFVLPGADWPPRWGPRASPPVSGVRPWDRVFPARLRLRVPGGDTARHRGRGVFIRSVKDACTSHCDAE